MKDLIFQFPLSVSFLAVISFLSIRHLWVNRKSFDEDYEDCLQESVFVQIIFLFFVLGSFFRPELGKMAVFAANFFFVLFSVYYSSVKSFYPLRGNTGSVEIREVLGRKLTPKYPGYSQGGSNFLWHLKMDLLALLGLWVFIFLDWKVIPWIFG